MSKGPCPVCRAAIPKGRFYTCSDRCAQIRAGLGPFTVPTVTDEELRQVHASLTAACVMASRRKEIA